jgi:hypothetical protein
MIEKERSLLIKGQATKDKGVVLSHKGLSNSM